jgi:hypothetical protein
MSLVEDNQRIAVVPKLFEWEGYKFFFFSNEGIPLEKCHIHVRKGSNIAKFWVGEEIQLASAWGMTPEELKKLERKISENRTEIQRGWNEYFK